MERWVERKIRRKMQITGWDEYHAQWDTIGGLVEHIESLRNTARY